MPSAAADPGSAEARVLALPVSGAVLPDVRGEARWMRVTWHAEDDLVVLSLWREAACVGTLRLARADVPAMVTALVEGLVPGRS